MKVLDREGRIFTVEEVKDFKYKQVFTLKWRCSVVTITRYSCCCSYFLELPNGKTRIRIRKWFPEWWWRT